MSYVVKFAHRTDWRLDINPLMHLKEKFQRENIAYIDLTESNPTHCGFHYPGEILSAFSKSQNLMYQPDPQGIPKAREAVSRYYQKKGFRVEPQRIFLTASTSEAYSFLFRLLLNPGEQVLIGQPSYPLFQFLLDLNDAQMDRYPLLYDERGWYIDLVTLEKAIHPKTKAIVVVNPNNPTGSFLTQQDLSGITEICQRRRLVLICDEVFSDYAFEEDPQRVLSLVDNRSILCFCLGGISKSLGLPQMKLSWMVGTGPQDTWRDALGRLEVIADTYLSVNALSQNALKIWFSMKEDIENQILRRLKQNLTFLKKAFLSLNQCCCLSPQGGWYAVVKLSPTQREEKWAFDFLKEDHVFVHPGYFFDFPEEPYVVLSLLPKPDLFKEGVNRILNRIRRNS